RVEPAPLDDLRIVAVDDLAHEPGIGEPCPDALDDRPPELRRDGVSGVKSPAVYAALQPVGHDVGDVGGDLGFGVVQRDEAVVALECAQIGVEPLPVRGLVAFGGDGREPGEASPDMVEDTVEQDTDALLRRLGKESLQVVLVAEPGVDPVVVNGVVAMSLRGEHRPEREPIAAEPDKVVEPAAEPPQPSRRRPALAAPALTVPAGYGPGEAEGIDMPPDGVLGPAHAHSPTRNAGGYGHARTRASRFSSSGRVIPARTMVSSSSAWWQRRTCWTPD